MYDKPITIQMQDAKTEKWTDYLKLHAQVNKTGGGTTFNAGADQFNANLTFKVRYIMPLEELRYKPQRYRIIYRGHTFKVANYDDFMEQHREVKLVGALYG